MKKYSITTNNLLLHHIFKLAEKLAHQNITMLDAPHKASVEEPPLQFPLVTAPFELDITATQSPRRRALLLPLQNRCDHLPPVAEGRQTICICVRE